MDILLFSLNGVGPVVLVILFGFFLRQIHLLNEQVVEAVNRLCFLVLIPILLFNSIREIDVIGDFDFSLVAYSIGTILGVFGLLYFLVPCFIHEPKQAGAFIQGVFRGNFLQFGFPLTLKLFGTVGATYAAMLLPFIVPLYNVLAVVLLTVFNGEALEDGEQPNNRRFKLGQVILDIIKNPLMISALIGIVFSLLRISLPSILDTALLDIGDVTPGLLLLLLGAQITPTKMNSQLLLASIATAFRLVIIPVFVLGGAIFLGFTGPRLGTIFVLFCVPTSISSHIMAIQMGSDHELAGKIVVFTTVASVFVLFLGVSLLRYFALF